MNVAKSFFLFVQKEQPLRILPSSSLRACHWCFLRDNPVKNDIFNEKTSCVPVSYKQTEQNNKKKTAEPVCSPVLSPHYHTCHT